MSKRNRAVGMGMQSFRRRNRSFVILSMLIASISCVLFFQVGNELTVSNGAGISNYDALLYCQYARAWAEGSPYSFNEQDPPTTGCTSHLYALVAALPYRMGARDNHLFTALYALNSALFVLSVLQFHRVMVRLAPREAGWSVLMYALSGQAAITCAGLSDMGLFVLLTMTVWNALLRRQPIRLLCWMVLLVFCRPEGSFIAMLFSLVVFGLGWRRHRAISKYIPAACGGIMAVMGVLLFQRTMTGLWGMDSTLFKGIWTQPVLLAVKNGVTDLMLVFQGVVFEIGGLHHAAVWVPMFAGGLMLFGMVGLPWKRLYIPRRMLSLMWVLAFVTTCVVVAAVGGVGLHHGRYFTWLFPPLYYFMFCGIRALPMRKAGRAPLAVFFIVYQAMGWGVSLHTYADEITRMEGNLRIVDQVDAALGNKTNGLAVLGGSGIKYVLPERTVLNFGGITVPYFRQAASQAERIEIVARMTNRPHYLFSSTGLQNWPVVLKGNQQSYGASDGMSAYAEMIEIDWTAMDNCNGPIDHVVQERVKGLSAIGSVDVGFPDDERAAKLRIYDRRAMVHYWPFISAFEWEQSVYADAARFVSGAAYFVLPAAPEGRHLLVLRLHRESRVPATGMSGELSVVARSGKSLELQVGGDWTTVVSPDFSESPVVEVAVVIPTEAVRCGTPEFRLYGDFVLSGVWLYACGDG